MIVADAHRQRGIETPDQLDPKAKRAGTEYFATLDDAAFAAATPVEAKFISTVDPAARWTASWGGPAVYAYCTNYLVDVQHAVIVDVEASTAVRQSRDDSRQEDDRARSRPPRSVAGAIGCRHRLRLGRDAELAGPRARDRAHIPVFDKSKRTDGTFSREDFTYDHASDT